MTKELIYTDITKVLYMMRNHGIRFECFNRYWGTWTEVTLMKLIKSAEAYYSDKFRVHPDDVAKFDFKEGDLVEGESFEPTGCCEPHCVSFFYYPKQLARDEKATKILERDGKEWLSPDKVRDVAIVP